MNWGRLWMVVYWLRRMGGSGSWVEEKKDFAPGTLERYNTCYKHVEDFIKLKFKRSDMSLFEINTMFIRNFEYYPKTMRDCSNNTTIKYIKNFKKIIRIAMANGWMKEDPFRNIRYHLDEVDMAYLTEEELKILMNKRFELDRHILPGILLQQLLH